MSSEFHVTKAFSPVKKDFSRVLSHPVCRRAINQLGPTVAGLTSGEGKKKKKKKTKGEVTAQGLRSTKKLRFNHNIK